jgi:IS5 family transposase
MLKLENGQRDLHQKLLERLVLKTHQYRKLRGLIDFSKLLKPLHELYSHTGKPSKALESGYKALLLQYWEDLSDRQLERYIQENNAARWFCGYGLEDTTPDHSYFGKLRKRIGVKKLSELFQAANEGLKKSGHVGNVFHFVDASSLLSKVNLWEARDKAIADKKNDEKDDEGKPKMNNSNVGDYSSDPDARFGCKGQNKFWYGYKRHNRVDMKQGLITKVAVTSANVSDAQAFIDEEMCPDEGMVFLDKGYEAEKVSKVIREKGCANAAILKNNRKQKNRDLDRWRSAVRMPFEGVFSKQTKHTRYRSKPKVFFQALMEAMVHNFKRLIQIESDALILSV